MEGATTHPVVAGPETSTDDQGDFWDRGGTDGGYEFGPVLGDALIFVFAAHHEPADVLDEQDWYVSLLTEFDEVGAFEGALGK